MPIVTGCAANRGGDDEDALMALAKKKQGKPKVEESEEDEDEEDASLTLQIRTGWVMAQHIQYSE